jgi:transposase-like protein
MSAEVATLEQRTAPYRTYPPEVKASIIAAIENNGGNVAKTAKLFCLPEDTVRYWWHNSDRYREVQGASGLGLADKLEVLAHANVDSLAAHDLSIVSYADKARGLGVIIDKMQLLRGQPTSITENIERQELTLTLQQSLAGVIDVDGE